jgi:photosystem II stability/assembly factor-like uncharacterized protein
MTIAQTWETVNPMPTSGTIMGISFINADTGFLASDEGEIFKTNNGGVDWAKLDIGKRPFFYDIKFPSDTKGFVVGSEHQLGRSLDAGNTWNFTILPGLISGMKINFVDDQHGWICGWYQTLFRTQDGGNTWTLLFSNVNKQKMYTCMDFLNQDTGYIAGFEFYYPSEGRLFRTLDGGITVEQISPPSESESISALDALSYNDVWLGESHQIQGQTRLYHTLDGGLTWETIVLAVYSSPISDIKFITPQKGMAIGGNYCYVTNDGGLTWSKHTILTSTNSASFASSDWVNDSVAYLGGYSGYIVKTNQSGSVWNELSHGTRAAFTDIDFFDEQTGCAVGSKPGGDFIYHTADGGQTWTQAITPSTNYEWILDVDYVSKSNVWAAGTQDRVYHSTDGGSTWSILNPTGNNLDYYFSICPVSDGRIYAGGSNLIYTDNNGQHWQYNDFECPGYGIRKVMFTDPLNGYLVLWEQDNYTSFYGKMFRTDDGGNTWEDINYNPDGVTSRILAADFLNKDIGIISIDGSGIATTIDGGLTWQQQGYHSNMIIYYLKMFNTKDAVAVTAGGSVFYSYNGGMDWEQVELTDGLQYSDNRNEISNFLTGKKPEVPSGIEGLLGTCFTGMGSGWLCRDNGLIRKYSYLNVGNDELVVKEAGNYKIYPNPASDIVQINGDKRFDYISIYNSLGKCIQQQAGFVNKIVVSGWPAGVYLMQIKNGRQTESLKFVKK